jgi:hypothetical protein
MGLFEKNNGSDSAEREKTEEKQRILTFKANIDTGLMVTGGLEFLFARFKNGGFWTGLYREGREEHQTAFQGYHKYPKLRLKRKPMPCSKT